MKVLEKGHVYQPQIRTPEGFFDEPAEQTIKFVNKQKGQEHSGTTTQEVIRSQASEGREQVLGLVPQTKAAGPDRPSRLLRRQFAQYRHHQDETSKSADFGPLAAVLNFDLSAFFKETAENYFGRVSKAGILEALREAQIEITPAMEKAKKGDLARIAERDIEKTKWLPELLRTPKP